MKSGIISLAILFLFFENIYSQNLFINGSFEMNNATGNTYTVNSGWNALVPHSWPLDAGTQDLLQTDTCGGASDGSWFVGMTQDPGFFYSAFSMEFSTPLIAGHYYELMFDYRVCGPNTPIVNLGFSRDSISFPPNDTDQTTFNPVQQSTWTNWSYDFVSSIDSKFLYLSANHQSQKEVDFDNFILIDMTEGINELTNDAIKLFPIPFYDKLNLQVNNVNLENKECNIIISDITGRICYNRNFSNIPNSIEFKEGFSGMYSLTINWNEGSLRKKIFRF